MCYYRLYIFLGCGHSTFSSIPVRYCSNARTERNAVGETQRISPGNEPTPVEFDELTKSDPSKNQVPERDSIDTLTSSNTQSTSIASEDTGATSIVSIRSPTTKLERIPCREGRAHPFHNVKIERICAVCEYEREQRLRALDASINEIKIEDWRWKLRHQGGPLMPLLQRNDRVETAETVKAGEERSSVRRMSAAVGNWVKEWQREAG